LWWGVCGSGWVGSVSEEGFGLRRGWHAWGKERQNKKNGGRAQIEEGLGLEALPRTAQTGGLPFQIGELKVEKGGPLGYKPKRKRRKKGGGVKDSRSMVMASKTKSRTQNLKRGTKKSLGRKKETANKKWCMGKVGGKLT